MPSVGRKLPRARIPKGMATVAGGAFELLHTVTRVKPPLTRETVKFMTSDRSYDISRAKKTLGWEPLTGIREGMRRAVAWYREKGLLGE